MVTVVDADGMTPNGALIDENVREGARRMLAAALEAEANAQAPRVNGAKVPKAVAKLTDDARDLLTFKLIESAQERWRAVNAPHLVALARAGARFERGVLLEREVAAA